MSDPVMPDGLRLAAPVHEVTVQEDRAQVYRVLRAELPAGRTTVIVEGLAPVASDKSLWAKVLEGPAGTRVEYLRMRRTRRANAGDTSEEFKTQIAEHDRLRDETVRLKRRLEAFEAECKQLGELETRFLEEVSVDASWGRSQTEEWRAQIKAFKSHEAHLDHGYLAADQELDEVEERLSDLSNRILAQHSPAVDCRTWLEADVSLPQAGAVEIRIAYVVGGACWRPLHEARLVEAAGRTAVQWESFACVWQNTGEDWTDAQLNFSTQRPSLGSAPPVLETDELAVVPRQKAVHVEMREEKIHVTGAGQSGAALESPAMPGIDDGGEVQVLRAPSRTTLRSDGLASRVPLFSFEAETQVELVAMPESAACVFLKSLQANAAPHPLLAGPVELLRSSGYIGRTVLLYTAPGERFELGWGPEPAMRLHRESRTLDPESNLLGTWSAKEHRVTIRLSNLDEATRTVRVRERMPVSEIEQVQVACETKHTTGGKTPDGNGMIDWNVTLKGRARDKIELRYTVKQKSGVTGV